MIIGLVLVIVAVIVGVVLMFGFMGLVVLMALSEKNG